MHAYIHTHTHTGVMCDSNVATRTHGDVLLSHAEYWCAYTHHHECHIRISGHVLDHYAWISRYEYVRVNFEFDGSFSSNLEQRQNACSAYKQLPRTFPIGCFFPTTSPHLTLPYLITVFMTMASYTCFFDIHTHASTRKTHGKIRKEVRMRAYRNIYAQGPQLKRSRVQESSFGHTFAVGRKKLVYRP